MRKLFSASIVAGLFCCIGIAQASPLWGMGGRSGCGRLWRIHAATTAARHYYAGINVPSRHDLKRLGRLLRCQLYPNREPYVRRAYKRDRKANAHRRYVYDHPPMDYANVSWYDDSGTTASGWHSYYGVAVCGSGGGPCVSFGTKIKFCYHGCITAVADDHGPYVSGRAFDLNQNTASAIGFGGVGTVGYHIY